MSVKISDMTDGGALQTTDWVEVSRPGAEPEDPRLTRRVLPNASGVPFNLNVTGSVERSLAAKAWEIVSVKDFGAVGDGVADDIAAFRAALLASSSIYVPPGHYIITNNLPIRSNQKIIGAGYSSYIENTASASPASEIFILGNQHPGAFEYAAAGEQYRYPCYDIDDVAEGDIWLTGFTGDEQDLIDENQFVWIRTIAEKTIFGGGGQTPHLAFLRKVLEVDSAGDRVRIDRPVPRSASAMTVSPIGDTEDGFIGGNFYVVENVLIDGLRLKGRTPFARGGVYNSKLSNLWLDCQRTMIINSVVFSTMENINGEFSDVGFEIKMASEGSLFQKIDIAYKKDAAVTPAIAAFEVGEQSFNCTFRDVDFSVGEDYAANFFLFGIQGWGHLFDGARLSHHGTTGGDVFFIPATDYGNFVPEDIIIRNAVIRQANKARHGYIGNSGNTLNKPKNITFDGVHFVGTTSQNRAPWIEYHSGEVRFNSCTWDGASIPTFGTFNNGAGRIDGKLAGSVIAFADQASVINTTSVLRNAGVFARDTTFGFEMVSQGGTAISPWASAAAFGTTRYRPGIPISGTYNGATWLASSGGTNEWYLSSTPPGAKPSAVLNDNTDLNEGSVGSLTDLQWAWGDNDTLGASTIYIRRDAGSPQAMSVHQIKYRA